MLFRSGVEPAKQSSSYAPNATNTPNTPTTSEGDEMNNPGFFARQLLGAYLTIANDMAQKGSSAEDGALFLYEKMPDEAIDVLTTQPKWFDLLCSFETRCQRHEQWYRAVHEKILEFIREDEMSEGSDTLSASDGFPPTIPMPGK